MYRTYEQPEGEYVIGISNGDCCSYIVCENETEYRQELDRIKRNNEECEREKESYRETLERKG